MKTTMVGVLGFLYAFWMFGGKYLKMCMSFGFMEGFFPIWEVLKMVWRGKFVVFGCKVKIENF